MSWAYEKLGNLITESRIPAINPDPNRRIRVKLNVLGVEKRPFENEVAGATKQFQRKAGQFIYGKQNFHKGAFGIIPDELDGFETSADIPSFDVREDCLAEWIFYYFKIGNRYLDMVKYARGVGSKRIHPEQIADVEIPLPSLKEQKKLIQKFKEVEESSQNICSEFINQEDLLTQLRQSFLREAMQGKLVKQDLKDGHAKDLLEKIKAEKAKSGKKEKELPPVKPEEIPFEIPENWVWCRLGEIISFGPSNGYSPKESKKGTGIKCLTLTATTSGKFKGEHYKLVDEQIASDSYLWLSKGDILLQRGNALEYVGIAALYEGESNEFIYPDLMIKVRVFEKLIYDRFIHKVLISPFNRTYFSDNAFGAQKSMPKINQGVVLNTMIPLPPLNEQYRIVDKIINIMTLCDDLQQSVQLSREQNELLLQQVLKETLNL